MKQITLGNLHIDRERFEARIGERRIHLTFVEFELLFHLARENGKVVPSDRLIEAIWGNPSDGDNTRLRIQISRLRKKISSSWPWKIQTIKKRGYGLVNSQARSGAAGSGACAHAYTNNRTEGRRTVMIGNMARSLATFRPFRWALWGFFIGFVALAVSSGMALAQENDPGGASTLEANPNAAVNFTWTLMAAFLVFFMQAGFALLEAGSVRAKSVVNVLTKNVMDFLMCAVAFWAFGFAFMFGGSGLGSGLAEGNDFIGYSGFFLTSDAYDVSTIELWMFQVVFAATAATIVSGAMAERTKVNAYMAYSFLISALIYPIYGHWVWGGGWLASIPFLDDYSAVDFAGSGVVHAVGGTAALVGAVMLGPRIGKYGPDGKPRSMPGHSVTLVVLGMLILFLGWFGFNPGSTVAATELRISVIAVNTFLAGVAGGLAAYYIRFAETGKVDIVATCSGIIGGLVAITAPCAWVEPWAALIIGAVAGPIVVYGARLLEYVLKVDDPVWAVACHMFSGLWGLLAVGIFADGTYGLYVTDEPHISGLINGDSTQIVAQLLSMAVVVTWTAVTSAIVFYGIKLTIGLRVPEEDELAGVDASEHTQVGYPEFVPGLADASTPRAVRSPAAGTMAPGASPAGGGG